jgi:hypothetical protein
VDQEFHGDVLGDVAGRDVVNQIHLDGNIRALTTLERKELNNKVKQLYENYGEQRWVTWRFLHRTIGVESVEEMRLDQRDSAHAILDLLIERAELRSGNQRQSDDADSSGEWAELIVKNSELAARLKESQAARQRLEQRLDEETGRAKSLGSQLGNAKSEAVRYEKLFVNSDNLSRQLVNDLFRSQQRGKRLMTMLVLFALTTIAGAATAFLQATKARAAEARLSVCTYGGKSYALGSVIDTNPDKECIRANDGRAVWKTVQEKPRRPR